MVDEDGLIDLTDEPRHVVEVLVTLGGCKPVRDDHPPIPLLVPQTGPMPTFVVGQDHGRDPDAAVVLTSPLGSTTIVEELPATGEPDQVILLSADQQHYRFDAEAGWVPHTPDPAAAAPKVLVDPPANAEPIRIARGGVKGPKREKAAS